MNPIKTQVEKAVNAVKEVVAPAPKAEESPAKTPEPRQPAKPRVIMVVGQRVEPDRRG